MQPKIFIGSSKEGLRIAQEISAALDYTAEMHQWVNAFPVAGATLQSLLDKFARCDMGIFLLSADDVSIQRKEEVLIARDNVLFEYGLFLGMHGVDRAFVVTPRNVDGKFHVPSDLAGITTAQYDAERAEKEPSAAVGKAVLEITKAIENSTWQQERVEILRANVTFEPEMHFKMKLHFRVVNNTEWPVAIRSVGFDYADQEYPTIENVYKKFGKVHKPEFRIGKLPDGETDAYRSQCYLKQGEEAEAWVAYQLPNDPAKYVEHVAALNQLLDKGRLAEWTYTCAWRGGRERAVTHKF